MSINININYEGWFAEFATRHQGKGLTRQGKRFLLKEANRKAVDFWHRRVIHKHFRPEARQRYHYQQRKAKYRGIKQDLAAGVEVFVNGEKLEPENIIKGGRVDIVRSGQTEQKARIPTPVLANSRSAKTRLVVPGYVLKKRPGGPDQKKEIQKVTFREKGLIRGAWRGQFLRAAHQFSGRFRLKRRLGSRSGKI